MKYIERLWLIWVLLLIVAIYLNFFSPYIKQFDGQREEYRKYRRMYKG